MLITIGTNVYNLGKYRRFSYHPSVYGLSSSLGLISDGGVDLLEGDEADQAWSLICALSESDHRRMMMPMVVWKYDSGELQIIR